MLSVVEIQSEQIDIKLYIYIFESLIKVSFKAEFISIGCCNTGAVCK
jgi:hypothetical protein